MKNTYLYLFILMFLFSCKDAKKEEVITLDDVTGASSGYKETGKKEAGKKSENFLFYDSLSPLSKIVIDKFGVEKNTVFPLGAVAVFPDRFGAKYSEKWYRKKENDSLVFMHWSFESQVKAENALYNWLDCWGKKCDAIAVGDEKKMSQRPFLLLQGEKDLFYIESGTRLQPEEWLETIAGDLKRKDWTFYIIQNPGKKVDWMNVKDLEILPLKKEEYENR